MRGLDLAFNDFAFCKHFYRSLKGVSLLPPPHSPDSENDIFIFITDPLYFPFVNLARPPPTLCDPLYFIQNISLTSVGVLTHTPEAWFSLRPVIINLAVAITSTAYAKRKHNHTCGSRDSRNTSKSVSRMRGFFALMLMLWTFSLPVCLCLLYSCHSVNQVKKKMGEIR